VPFAGIVPTLNVSDPRFAAGIDEKEEGCCCPVLAPVPLKLLLVLVVAVVSAVALLLTLLPVTPITVTTTPVALAVPTF
jgi:hypothetical protein